MTDHAIHEEQRKKKMFTKNRTRKKNILSSNVVYVEQSRISCIW